MHMMNGVALCGLAPSFPPVGGMAAGWRQYGGVVLCGMAHIFPPVGGIAAGSGQHGHFALVLSVWRESGKV